MKLLIILVALLSVSSAGAAGWGSPQGKKLSIMSPSTTKEAARIQAVTKKLQGGAVVLLLVAGSLRDSTPNP